MASYVYKSQKIQLLLLEQYEKLNINEKYLYTISIPEKKIFIPQKIAKLYDITKLQAVDSFSSRLIKIFAGFYVLQHDKNNLYRIKNIDDDLEQLIVMQGDLPYLFWLLVRIKFEMGKNIEILEDIDRKKMIRRTIFLN